MYVLVNPGHYFLDDVQLHKSLEEEVPVRQLTIKLIEH